MGRRVDVDRGAQQTAVAEVDRADVQEDTAEVREEVVADGYLLAVVTPERWFDGRALADLPEQFFLDEVSTLPVGRDGLIVQPDELSGAFTFGDELGVPRVVQLPGEHLRFLTGHRGVWSAGSIRLWGL